MLEILYRDSDIAVVIKPVGVVSEDTEGSVPSLIRAALSVEDVYTIHRLDREVGGVMVYALTKRAASELSRAVADNALEKIYLAVVHGVPSEPSGVYSDLLFKDSKKNKSYVVTRERKGVRRAELSYETLCTKAERSLVRIKLHTGRSHQIRVQFSSRKMPLVGDRKYGSDEKCNIALFSHILSFPYRGKTLTFSASPSGDVWDDMM
ncbi:MAG: RluA family pseudouridine synthase [Ruminococcaceae bacterium]|nr:RluA family pseudouridine synthase [Oscillospiraceae bacterium]